MKATELRLGNFLFFTPGKNTKRMCPVKEIGRRSIIVLDMGLDLELFELEPIPLTPKILDECGFEKNRIFIVNITIEVDIEYEMVFIEQWQNGEVNIVLPIEIKYLHQLQNLYFALTGKELEVNLTEI